MGKIKVIFLYVDGVLNSDRTARRTQSGYPHLERQMKDGFYSDKTRPHEVGGLTEELR